MADRGSRRRRLLLLAAVVLAALGACGDGECEDGLCVEESSARLLDDACRPNSAVPCTVSGDAEATSGITDDSVGFHIGDGTGTVAIPLEALDPDMLVSGVFDLQVLVAGSIEGATTELSAKLTWGSCTSCPPDPSPFIGQVSHEYTWVTVVSRQATTGAAVGVIPPDAALTLSGRNLDIADLRTVVTTPQFGCSIAGGAGVLRR